jgi:HEAT repeat protein
VLRALRLGDAGLFAGFLADSDPAVRIEAVRALVSVDAAGALAGAVGDPSREVRVTVAKALGTVGAVGAASGGDGVLDALALLVGDADVLVRGAAYEALAGVGCPALLAGPAVAALGDPAWQVRVGAGRALGAADGAVAVPALATSIADRNADVRKAAVLALTRHAGAEEVRAALATATADPDADVRAYAARGL